MLKVLYIGEAPYKVLGELVKPTLAQAWNVPESALVSVQITDDISEMKKLIGKGAMNQDKSRELGKYSAEGTVIVLERTTKEDIISLVHKFASNARIDIRDNYEPVDLEDLDDSAIEEWARTGRVPQAAPDPDEMDFDDMFGDGDDEPTPNSAPEDSMDSLFDDPGVPSQSGYAPAATPENLQRIAPTNRNAPPMPGEGPRQDQGQDQRYDQPQQSQRRQPEPPPQQEEPDVNNIPGFSSGDNQLPPAPPRPPEPPQVTPERHPEPEPPTPPQHETRRERRDAEEQGRFPVPRDELERETYRQQIHEQNSGGPSFRLDHDSPGEEDFKQDIFGEQDHDREPPTQSIDMTQGDHDPFQQYRGNDQRYGSNPNHWPGQPQQGYPGGPPPQSYPPQQGYPFQQGQSYPGQPGWNGGYGSQPGGWNQPPQQYGYPQQNPSYPPQGSPNPGNGWPGNGPQPRGDIVPFMQHLPEDAQRRQSHSAEIQRAAGSIRHDQSRHNQGTCLYMTGNRGGIGKSTLTWVLANLLAHLRQSQGGRQVWLVEADYKNPKMEFQLQRMGSNLGNLVDVFRSINPNTAPERIMELIKRNSVKIDGSNLRVLPAPFQFEEYNSQDIGWVLQRVTQFLTGLGDTVFIDANNVTSDKYEPLDQVLAGRLATHCVVVSTPKHLEMSMRSVVTLTSEVFGKTPNSVHIFMNRSNKEQLNEATNYFASNRIGTIGAFPLITELIDEWVGDTTPEINQALVARAGLALSSLGFPEARSGFGEVEVDMDKKPSMFRRLMNRMGL